VTRGSLVAAAALALACAASPAPEPAPGSAAAGAPAPARTFVPRPLRPVLGARFVGPGICYGPHRDGQRPGGPSPTRAELREDLALLAERWSLLRLYASDGPAADVLALVHGERLPFKVLLGAWIAPETTPAARAANRAQVEGAVRLAEAYPGVVLGLVIGNETQVSWSAHRVAPELLIGWIREARRATSAPVATADDFGFWLSPASDAVAREVDFVVTHVYAMWNGTSLEDALPFTQARYVEVVRRHPGLPVVLGEAGWATRRHVEGEQARLIRGEPGEGPQRRFFEAFTAWTTGERIVATWFEAFDERWKGGPHPDEVEKHWGLFRADRTRKQAVAAPP
jgi:exo-beta-1,3-glucanase (GH17 family)